MKVEKLINELNKIFPLELQESYDNTGEQIIFRELELTGVLVALDPDTALIGEAENIGANFIVTHHPLFFKSVRKIDTSDAKSEFIIQCIENKISLYSAHTNLDRIFRHKLCEEIGFKPTDTLIKDAKEAGGLGFGSIADIDKPLSMKELLSSVLEHLEMDFCLYTGGIDKMVSRIAFLNGAGGGSIEKIINWWKPDCIITGDVNHHNARYAIERNTAVINAGHYGTERIFLKFLADEVRGCLPREAGESVPVEISAREKNPFSVFEGK